MYGIILGLVVPVGIDYIECLRPGLLLDPQEDHLPYGTGISPVAFGRQWNMTDRSKAARRARLLPVLQRESCLDIEAVGQSHEDLAKVKLLVRERDVELGVVRLLERSVHTGGSCQISFNPS